MMTVPEQVLVNELNKIRRETRLNKELQGRADPVISLCLR